MIEFLNELEAVLKDRKQTPKEGSYTSDLYQKGLDRILKKVGEEAGEVIIAAKNNDSEELAQETADLLFHLMVTLVDQGVDLQDVIAVLKSRHQ